MQKETKKLLAEICRYLLGVVFVFSGFVKAIDPLGGAYKILEYLRSFGQDWLAAVDLPMSFVQAALEFTVGICLLLGVYRQRTTLITLIIMLFMTPLTLYIAIKNPVTDCGCFGDALVITNWQTFYKNIVLLVAAIVVALNYRKITPIFSHRAYTSAVVWTYAFIIGFTFHNYYSLPIFDFRPYKIGANIPELMKIPEGAPTDEYEIALIYKKDGKEQEFTLDNYPKDGTWEFVNQKSTLIKKGFEPPIHDFSIIDSNEDDITQTILSDTSYTFLLISTDFSAASDINASKINAIYEYAKKLNYNFYGFTSSTSDVIEDSRKSTGAEYPICTGDKTTIKTIIRSNPGLMLIKAGTIINKWADNNIPDEVKSGQIPKKHTSLKLLVVTAIFCVPMSVLYLIDRKKRKRRRKKKQENINNFIK